MVSTFGEHRIVKGNTRGSGYRSVSGRFFSDSSLLFTVDFCVERKPYPSSVSHPFHPSLSFVLTTVSMSFLK